MSIDLWYTAETGALSALFSVFPVRRNIYIYVYVQCTQTEIGSTIYAAGLDIEVTTSTPLL